MAIDTSIYSNIRPVQIESPLNALAQVEQLRNAQNQNKLFDAQMQERQRAMADDEAVRRTYAQNSDPTVRLNALAGVSPKAYQAEAKFQTDQQKEKAVAYETQLKNAKAVNGLFGSAAYAILQNPTYENAVAVHEHLKSQLPPDMAVKMDGSEIPRDPVALKAWANNHYLKSIETDKLMSDATSRRNNDNTNAVTIRGQNLTDARGREANAISRERLTFDKSNGKAANATEDERKAAGWVSQAENAWANMQSVIKSNPSAAKPGFAESVASLLPGDAAANMVRPADRQRFVQASSSLSEALLRAATGAGVNAYEAQQKVAEITPQIGDKPEVRDQKLKAIPVYLESLRLRAGRALPQKSTVAASPAVEPTPAATPVQGIKFLGFE